MVTSCSTARIIAVFGCDQTIRMLAWIIRVRPYWVQFLPHDHIQWDLFVKDTLGPANLSTVERLSTLQR